jgi:hypothetical protein
MIPVQYAQPHQNGMRAYAAPQVQQNVFKPTAGLESMFLNRRLEPHRLASHFGVAGHTGLESLHRRVCIVRANVRVPMCPYRGTAITNTLRPGSRSMASMASTIRCKLIPRASTAISRNTYTRRICMVAR